MQLRRVTVCIQVCFIALWRGEITPSDAQIAVNDILHVLRVFGTRWQSAFSSQETIVQLAVRSGEHLLGLRANIIGLTILDITQPATMEQSIKAGRNELDVFPSIANISTFFDGPWPTDPLSNDDASEIMWVIDASRLTR
jgi:hypothetical protein